MNSYQANSKIDITVFRFALIFKVFSWLPFYFMFVNFINFEAGVILSNISYIIAYGLLFVAKSQMSYYKNQYLRKSVKVSSAMLIYPVIHFILILSSGTGFNFHTPIIFVLWLSLLLDSDSMILISQLKEWLATKRIREEENEDRNDFDMVE